MTALSDMIMRAKSAPKHIVLAEGHDPRIIQAAVKAVKDNKRGLHSSVMKTL